MVLFVLYYRLCGVTPEQNVANKMCLSDIRFIVRRSLLAIPFCRAWWMSNLSTNMSTSTLLKPEYKYSLSTSTLQQKPEYKYEYEYTVKRLQYNTITFNSPPKRKFLW